MIGQDGDSAAVSGAEGCESVFKLLFLLALLERTVKSVTGTAQLRMVGAQAVYHILTGLWPLVHLPSFETVTGPKADDWLAGS